MESCSYIFGLISVIFLSVASASIQEDKSHQEEAIDIDKRQGTYQNQYSNYPYNYEYNNNQNQYSKGASKNSYDVVEKNYAIDEPFSSSELDRQDIFGGDSALAIGLAALAGVAAGAALVWNTQQTSNSDFDDLKSRVASLESDQTNICTAIKSVGDASSGKTIADGYTDDAAGERGFLVALAAVSTPTCS